MTTFTGVGVTVIAALAVFPSLVAVMLTGPPAVTPVTTPLLDTVATAALAVDHDTVLPVIAAPPASLGVATSAIVPPSATWPLDTLRVTVATAAGGGGGGVLPLGELEQAARRVKPRRLRLWRMRHSG